MTTAEEIARLENISIEQYAAELGATGDDNQAPAPLAIAAASREQLLQHLRRELDTHEVR